MTELNLFLRFNAPSNEGCSTYSKVRSALEFLNPKERILLAAFLSLSCVVLQFSQVHSLTSSVSSLFIAPHVLQILLDGSNLPIYSTFFPFHSDLYLSIVSNIFHPQSLIAPASLWFLTMPLIFKSSNITRLKRLVISFVALCKKSLRWLLTFSCCFAILNFQTFLRLLPFTFLESCRCIHFNLTIALRKCFGLAYSVPSEQTAKVLIPKSIPTALLLLSGLGSSLWLSTNTDTKYLFVGVLLIVTVLTSPVNFLCRTALIGSLNFGKSMQLFLKSTLTLCGSWKDCLLVFFLKFGNDARPLKKFWKELSKFRKAICKHWLFTSRNHSHSFFKSVSCAESSLYESEILLPAYAVDFVSKARLYRNLTHPKCLSKSNFCSSVGEILYLKARNINAKIDAFYRNTIIIIRNLIIFTKAIKGAGRLHPIHAKAMYGFYAPFYKI